MENEIIIDGVNVAECDCYDNTYCLWSKKYHEIRITPKCEMVKDCYFKQLQCAKAELEQYKKDIKDGVGCIQCEKELENDTLHITISKLKADLSQAETSLYTWKAENEKLKIRNIELEAYFKVNEDFQKAWQELNSMHNNLQQVYQDEHCDNLKYKQALEEVKKYCNECNLKADYTACEVLKIINEILND